jgi:hypothetical protein
MSTTTTATGLTKPSGTDPFTRSVLNTNSDLIDKQAIVLGLAAAFYGTLTKGAMVFDGSGNPQSQTISGPNGLTGSVTYTITSSQITEVLSITAPTAFSLTKTINTSTLAETWAVS